MAMSIATHSEALGSPWGIQAEPTSRLQHGDKERIADLLWEHCRVHFVDEEESACNALVNCADRCGPGQ
jgi:hypothetical protein